MPASHENTNLVHAYGNAEQPLQLHDDDPTIVLSVPEKGAPSVPKQTAASQ
jgi:hypothetical protein